MKKILFILLAFCHTICAAQTFPLSDFTDTIPPKPYTKDWYPLNYAGDGFSVSVVGGKLHVEKYFPISLHCDKKPLVIEDQHERGIRKCLNFGHTIGHEVQTYSLLNDENPLSHGEAIVIGMICEAYLAHKKIGLKAEELQDITETFGRLYPRCQLSEAFNETLYEFMLKDKKNSNGKINCTLLTHIGMCSIDHICSKEDLFEALGYYRDLN